MIKVRQTFQISLTDVNCTCAIYAVGTVSNPHPSTILLMAPMINMWWKYNRQLLAVRWLVDCFKYVYQVVGELI